MLKIAYTLGVRQACHDAGLLYKEAGGKTQRALKALLGKETSSAGKLKKLLGGGDISSVLQRGITSQEKTRAARKLLAKGEPLPDLQERLLRLKVRKAGGTGKLSPTASPEYPMSRHVGPATKVPHEGLSPEGLALKNFPEFTRTTYSDPARELIDFI